MKSATDTSDYHKMLLSTLDLDEVVDTVYAIILQVCEPKAFAVAVWDGDLESFNDKFLFGPKKKEFSKFLDAYVEEVLEGLDEKTKKLEEVNLDECQASVPRELEPVYVLHLVTPDKRAGMILIAGDGEIDEAQLEKDLSDYPFFPAIANSWEVRELRKENERLRERYEELEQQNTVLEEQTRKLIHETMTKDSFRTQQTQKDRLVYEISNACRSSLEIKQVLQTTVDKIGEAFHLSRCLLMRGDYSVFEWHSPTTPSATELFDSDKGRAFIELALSKRAPHDFPDNNQFDKEFTQDMQLASGLLVPMVMRDTTIGTIFLQDCETPRQWTIDNIALLGSLADQLSVALENADLHAEREKQAKTDGLTGIYNRRHFNEAFGHEFSRAHRYGETLSIIVLDLDFLKKINDTYGHNVGDQAIKAIGQVLANSCRGIDIAARYGGEEFCVVLPNTDVGMAESTAERLRKIISETPVEGPGQVTASIGVANFPLHANEPDALFKAADEALYRAKEAGRNKVCVAERLSG